MNQKSSKVEKLDWDRSQLSQILCTIQHNEKRSVRHGHFHSTGSRREDQDTVEKLASRVYFADRYKYGTGESFQNNQGRPFQLPRIQNNNTYKYEQTVWRHTSQDITLPGTIYSFPQPPSKKHTLNTIQTANILQDLNLFHNPQEEKTFTKLPKQILDVDPEFFKIIQGRRIKSKFDSNYVSNVRRVLLTKLRIGVIKDEIDKIKRQFIRDKNMIDVTRDKLTQDYFKYEQFIRNDYKQVMLIENQSKLSWQRLSQAQEEHDSAHKDYYDVRISLFELDEKWTHAKLCKNFVYLMTSLSQVRDDEQKLVLINKVNALNLMKMSNTLEDIVDNFKRDLETVKQEIQERKCMKKDSRQDKKKLEKKKTTEYEIYDDDDDDDTFKTEKVENIQDSEEKTEEKVKDIQEDFRYEQTIHTNELVDEKTGENQNIQETTENVDKLIGEGIDPEEVDDGDNSKDEFINLIIMDDVKLEKHRDITKTSDIEINMNEKFQEELGFDLKDIDIDDDYDMKNIEETSVIFEKLDLENMNVLLQKENIQDKLEQCKKMNETSEEYFTSKAKHLRHTVETLSEKMEALQTDIGEIRNDIKNNYEAYINDICSNKNYLVLQVLIADLYERCISKNKNLHYLSTLEQLTQFQDNIQDLLSRINVIPIQFVSEAKAFVSKNMEETNRSATNAKRKLNELDNYLQHLERTLMPKYKKIGKPLHRRSKPPTSPLPRLKQAKSLTQDEMDYLMFFTDFDSKAPSADQLAQTYLNQRKMKHCTEK
ncbi:cilia- and flagella-associated protein 100-like isoform X3 [Diaphorina citri]|nr:cilia- and flagella-associated protein 100-like isoform X3 [Diaphorina citri]XP_026683283.1 cilia- and flagella-associated protein 100-like isoform X3 [Diaphorina citri]